VGVVLWRTILAPSLTGGYDISLEVPGTVRCGNGWFTTIDRSPQLRIASSCVYVLRLSCNSVYVALMSPLLFLWGRPRLNSAASAIKSDMTVIHNRDVLVINIANVNYIDVRNFAVIEEMVSLPTTSPEAIAEISEAIVDTAVESNMRSPPTRMEDIESPIPTPPGRSPEIADLWSLYPCTRYPIVALLVRVPRPVPRGPHVTIAGTQRLLIDWKRRRAKIHGDTDLGERRH
jgi:hypothetical protein